MLSALLSLSLAISLIPGTSLVFAEDGSGTSGNAGTEVSGSETGGSSSESGTDVSGSETGSGSESGSGSETGGSGEGGESGGEVTPDPEPVVKLGWITEDGKTYYYDTENHFVTGMKSISGKKYIFASDGVLQCGIVKYSGKYYYADAKGVLRTTKGFVTVSGKKYYVQSGGVIITSRTFTLSKKKYRAAGNGQIKTGVYKWGSYYYYSDSKGVVRTKKGLFRWNGNTYYSYKGGKLATSKFIKSGKYYYRMQASGAAYRTAFKYHDVTIKPNSKTGAITKSQYKRASYGPYQYKKYILIDLSDQTLKYYVSGKVKLSSPVVTGGPGARTPTGKFKVGRKSRNTKLVGSDYVTKVSYWIPFIGQAYGMHDASWRSSFGGSIYKYSGSHGCVNMPYAKVKKLYSMVSKGTMVIVRK